MCSSGTVIQCRRTNNTEMWPFVGPHLVWFVDSALNASDLCEIGRLHMIIIARQTHRS